MLRKIAFNVNVAINPKSSSAPLIEMNHFCMVRLHLAEPAATDDKEFFMEIDLSTVTVVNHVKKHTVICQGLFKIT